MSDYPPGWYRPSKSSARQNLNVARGLHPMGMRLGNLHEFASCGNCRHHVSRSYSRTYHKCSKTRQSGGPATDIRLKWPACELWEGERCRDEQ